MQVTSVAERLFFTTVRIDTFGHDGSQGSGTGFIFNYPIEGDTRALFLVTNKHVVFGMREGQFSFLKQRDGGPAIGEGFTLHIDPSDWVNLWFGHPDSETDIAICPLVPLLNFIKIHHGIDIFFCAVDSSDIPTIEQTSNLDAIEPVTFVGYPNGIWDTKNLLPVARRGTTATPVEVDFEGTPRFIIDASVFGGSSGSPVFILNQGSWSSKDGAMMIGSRFYFIGVIAAVFYRTQRNEVVAAQVPTHLQPIVHNQEMIDLGIVFKSRTVVETVQAFLSSKTIDM